jgi:hypothetical protein
MDAETSTMFDTRSVNFFFVAINMDLSSSTLHINYKPRENVNGAIDKFRHCYS